jgi:hypothetical protein
MTHIAAESLFHLAIAMRAAYPRRSSYDRRSSLTAADAIGYGERLMKEAGRTSDIVIQPIWQPGR